MPNNHVHSPLAVASIACGAIIAVLPLDFNQMLLGVAIALVALNLGSSLIKPTLEFIRTQETKRRIKVALERKQSN